MTTNTRQFHEFGYTLASLADDAVKAQYEAAFDADPVNGFRFGHHIKNRGFAGELFKKAAALAPASAFADFESYAYVLPRNALYEITDDAEFEKAMRPKIAEGVISTAAQLRQNGKEEDAKLVEQKDQTAMLQDAKKARAEYQQKQRIYDWAEDVLLGAAEASPKAAFAYEKSLMAYGKAQDGPTADLMSRVLHHARVVQMQMASNAAFIHGQTKMPNNGVTGAEREGVLGARSRGKS